nr:helix-turn-helix domain-containing protein [uncultured Undibacterium sp.]
MSADDINIQLAKIAAAIAEPARATMLCALMDGRARTSTELAMLAEISPSTASVHLGKLRDQSLVQVLAQGKHRYYQLAGGQVAVALESLMAIAGRMLPNFTPSTPERLRQARTCYDHMAGEYAVAIHDYLLRNTYLIAQQDPTTYELSADGEQLFISIGIELEAMKKGRRRFACACVDWSERRPHIGGAVGAALLRHFVQHGWVETDLDSRALRLTPKGRRQFAKYFGLFAT